MKRKTLSGLIFIAVLLMSVYHVSIKAANSQSSALSLTIESEPESLIDKGKALAEFGKFLDENNINLEGQRIYIKAYDTFYFNLKGMDDAADAKSRISLHPDVFKGVILFYGGPAGSLVRVQGTERISELTVKEIVMMAKVAEMENKGDYSGASLEMAKAIAKRMGANKETEQGKDGTEQKPVITSFEITNPTENEVDNWDGSCELTIEAENMEEITRNYRVDAAIYGRKVGQMGEKPDDNSMILAQWLSLTPQASVKLKASLATLAEAQNVYGNLLEIECRFALYKAGTSSKEIVKEARKIFTVKFKERRKDSGERKKVTITRFDVTNPMESEIRHWDEKCELTIEGQNLFTLREIVSGVWVEIIAISDRFQSGYGLGAGYVRLSSVRDNNNIEMLTDNKIIIGFAADKERLESAKEYEKGDFNIECIFRLSERVLNDDYDIDIKQEAKKSFRLKAGIIKRIDTIQTVPDNLKTGAAKAQLQNEFYALNYLGERIIPPTHAIAVFSIWHGLGSGKNLLEQDNLRIDVIDSKGRSIMKAPEVLIELKDELFGGITVTEVKIGVRFFAITKNILGQRDIKKTLVDGETYTIQLKDESGYVLQPDIFRITYDDAKMECIELDKDNTNGKFKIYLAGIGYDNLEDFVADAKNSKGHLLSVEPFKSNLEIFDFYYNTYPFSGDFYALLHLGNACPATQKIFLEKGREFRSFASGGEGGFTVIDLHDLNKKVLAHEFGHLFGLGDEYLEGDLPEGNKQHEEWFKHRYKAPNCVPTQQEAEAEWGDLVGLGEGRIKVGYFRGCAGSAPDYIRPHENSIMRSHYSIPEEEVGRSYGPVNERYICRDVMKTRGGICREYYDLCLQTNPKEECGKWYNN